MRPLLAIVLAILLVTAGCDSAGDDATSTTEAETPGTLESPALQCGDAIPVFPAFTWAEDAADVESRSGPGPGSVPAEAGQVVAHWSRDFDVVLEIRWPASPVPAGAEPTGAITDGIYPVELWLPVATGASERVIATVQVGDAASDPCSFLSVEGYAPRADPIPDQLYDFVTSLQPLDAKPAFLAALLAKEAPAPESDRPPGACAEPVPAEVGDDGAPDPEASLLLAEHFLADRLAGNAAEQCLTVSGARAYRDGEPQGTLPDLCLVECDGVTLVGGEVVAGGGEDGRVELLILYQLGDAVRQFREFLEVTPVDDGAGGHTVLINDARLGPESEIDEATAHLVIEDFLDAVAVGEYQIAGGYLLNEGFSAEVEERLGDLWETPPAELFPAFCARAACGAPYEIGDTVAVGQYTRTLEVTFDTAAGPVTVPLGTGMFEGVTTVSSLPPDGAAGGTADPIDVRVFGEPYDGTLLAGRYVAVERITDGERVWEPAYRLRWATSFAAAGEHVVYESMDTVSAGFDSGAPGSELAAAPFTLAGAGSSGGHSLAFVSDGRQLDAVDLDTGRQATLLDLGGRDGTIHGADLAGDTLLVSLGVGDSAWYEVYQIDPAALTIGPDGRTLEPDEPVGIGHLSPDATRIATALRDSSVGPIDAVAVLDVASGAVLDRWALDDVETVTDLDFDGRWILARLDGRTLLVVDTDSGEARRVDTSVLIRFG